MVAFLAVVAVVGYMASAGLPWWVVALVALLTAGFVGGVSGSPARGARGSATSGPAGQPMIPMADHEPTAPPVSVNACAAESDGPDGWDARVPTGTADRALR